MLKRFLLSLAVSGSVFLSGCATLGNFDRGAESAVTTGPSVTHNPTPYSVALQCTSLLAPPIDKNIQIGIGKFPDLTGKFSNDDGGYKVTQGAQMMAMSALRHLKQVDAVERIDVSVASFELDMANRKVLGDGEVVKVNGKPINWRPVISGSMVGSDYYITGGIIELNYNIFSGGAELGINNVGVGARQFVLNVATDIRIVNTRTLQVIKSVSLQKQVVGYELTAGIFKFIDDSLIDFNAGEKTQEPIQLAVRSIIEAGMADLVGTVLNSDSESCIRHAEYWFYNQKQQLAMMTTPSEIAQKIATDIENGVELPDPVTVVKDLDEPKSDNVVILGEEF